MTTSTHAEHVPLRAGPLRMVFENGDLRYVRLGSELVLLRVYWAVRDQNWGTAPVQISDLHIDAREDAFDVRYSAWCVSVQHNIDFRAEVHIAGAADGAFTFTLNGVAHSDFLRNRIGFCVLHPSQQAGASCEVEHVDGTTEAATLPKFIVGAQPLSPFEEMRGLHVKLKNKAAAVMHFEGDIFEMEDQRNWTDASFKTFCTPLRLPYPVAIKQGDLVKQSVTLKIENAPARKRSYERHTIAFTISKESKPLPPIGLGQSFAGKRLTARQIEYLRALKLHHLRVDLDLHGGWQSELRRAVKDAGALGVKLEVALFVDNESAYAQLAALRKMIDVVKPKVSHWLILPREEKQNEAPAIGALVASARETLSSFNRKAIFAAGTDADFIFANKQAHAYRGMDAFVMPTNPQTHAFDNASLVETLAAQGVLVQSAMRLAKGKPVIVSPVTLKPRWNPYSTAGATKGEPPADPRQVTWFGAAWTLGSIKYLAEAGASSLTFYETVGARGVMDRNVFPLWYVLADVGEFAGGEIIPSKSSEPLQVDGLALRKGRRVRMLLANFTAQAQTVKLPDAWVELQPFAVTRSDMSA